MANKKHKNNTMNYDYSLTLVNEDDWEDLKQLVVPIVREGTTYSYSPDSSEDWLRDQWMNKPEETWVVRSPSSEIVGTYYIKPNQPGLGNHIANAGFMVRKGKKGIGSFMATHCLSRCKQLGFEGIQFNFVVSTNSRAIELWKRFGFAIVGSIPNGFRHPSNGLIDVYVMHRSLNDWE